MRRYGPSARIRSLPAYRGGALNGSGFFVVSATVAVDGFTLTIVFNTAPKTNNTGFSLVSIAMGSLTYSSTSGVTQVYAIGSSVVSGEVVTLSYALGNVQSAYGLPLAAFTGKPVINNSGV